MSMNDRNATAKTAGETGVHELGSALAGHFAEPTDPARWLLPVEDVLGKHHFLQQMEREKLRTNRSNAPLSIVLFHIETSHPGECGGVEALLRVLRHSKRETDILGYLGEDLFALLLPDTDEPGIRAFIRKIEPRIERFRISTMWETYPHKIFHELLTQSKDLSRLSFFVSGGLKESSESGHPLKRTLDIVGAAAGILLLSPLMLITALVIAFDSPGPILSRQTRVGRQGVPFVSYKFRSMLVTADDRMCREVGELAEVKPSDVNSPCHKATSNPRVTRVGKFIRDTSIDELPQLFNVLKGDMSLVGPRPPLPDEVENYRAWHLMRILEFKPGIRSVARGRTRLDHVRQHGEHGPAVQPDLLAGIGHQNIVRDHHEAAQAGLTDCAGMGLMNRTLPSAQPTPLSPS